MELNVGSIEHDVVELFDKLFQACLASGKARLTVDRSGRGPGSSVTASPSAPNAASITAFVENGDDTVYLTVGRATALEVPATGGRYTAIKGVGELICLIDAIADGRFQEIVWTKNSHVVRSISELQVQTPTGDQPVVVRGWQVFTNPFVRSHKHEFDYAPYGCPIGVTEGTTY